MTANILLYMKMYIVLYEMIYIFMYNKMYFLLYEMMYNKIFYYTSSRITRNTFSCTMKYLLSLYTVLYNNNKYFNVYRLV